jgi:hypothetical protein
MDANAIFTLVAAPKHDRDVNDHSKWPSKLLITGSY